MTLKEYLLVLVSNYTDEYGYTQINDRDYVTFSDNKWLYKDEVINYIENKSIMTIHIRVSSVNKSNHYDFCFTLNENDYNIDFDTFTNFNRGYKFKQVVSFLELSKRKVKIDCFLQ